MHMRNLTDNTIYILYNLLDERAIKKICEIFSFSFIK